MPRRRENFRFFPTSACRMCRDSLYYPLSIVDITIHSERKGPIAPMGKRVQKYQPSRLFLLGRLLYRLLVVLSVLVVLLFCAYQLLRQKPGQASGPAPSAVLPSAQPSGELAPTGLERKKDTWTFLLAASDQASGNADTIMVGMYDTVNQKAGLVSIPRDTIYHGTRPDGGHYYKINSTYAYYGAKGMQEAVSELLGIPVDHYVTIDLAGFEAIVNAVDGVDFEIPVPMSYDDPTQDLHIHFQPGMTHLDGQEAMEVCRFRHNNFNEAQVAYTDVDRTRTQQEILTLIAKKVLSQPQKVGEYVEIFSEYIDTDLSLGEMLWFVEPALGFDLANLSTATLPGDGTVTYKGWTYCYQLEQEESLAIINEMINPYTTPVTLDMVNMPQT